NQVDIIDQIESAQTNTFLLHGETGSGKTRVYFERVHRALEAGRSALVLIPEISLIPQITELFSVHFGTQVVVLHSGLTKAARNKNWLKVLHAQGPLVVIGTRSSLFAPLNDIGTIIVDEMHE